MTGFGCCCWYWQQLASHVIINAVFAPLNQLRVRASAFVGHGLVVAFLNGSRRCRKPGRWISSIRLINTETLKLEEPIEAPSRYAILSHTGKGRWKKGFAKIAQTCRLARLQDIPYAWIDTSCIDKTNSAELTQAINSMFRWYAKATVCYPYLDDLAPSDRVRNDMKDVTMEFASCRWFTRGWTLQELIAPNRVEFSDKVDVLEATTQINSEVLCDNSRLFSLPVATRMSWAAKQQTTRDEDMAYCLLGIFDVNMPTIYGEGTKAFIRLQEEIARQTNDLTLFAWKQLEATPQYRGVLAKSPTEFRDSWSIVPNSDRRFNEEFSMTNKGLRIKGDPNQSTRGDYFLGLSCSYRHAPDEQIGIYLKHHGAGLYARQLPQILPVDTEPPFPAATTSYIDKHLSPVASESIDKGRRHGIRLRRGFEDVLITSALPLDQWDRKHKLFLTGGGHSPFAGVLTLRSERWTGDLTIMCALLVQGAVPLVKFIDNNQVGSVLEEAN
ncbi:HET-domain-containing protein [Stipitochalara longipes BDJ]|nr:HET-domain-containing protein [Stipitochalara longipes BDJ]